MEDQRTTSQQELASRKEDVEAIAHFEQAVASGSQHWYLALLDAVGLWTSPEETFRGRHYRYLIAHEAFDWLLLAERLCQTVNGSIPEKEKERLLLYGLPPLEVSEDEFKRRIGPAKYRAYLNYLYGVILEEALHAAVEEEVTKEGLTGPSRRRQRVDGEVYGRIYGESLKDLRQRYLTETGRIGESFDKSSLSDLREFTYWLFKHRLRACDKARVASDTKKALALLERQRLSGSARLSSREQEEEPGDVIELSTFFVRSPARDTLRREPASSGARGGRR